MWPWRVSQTRNAPAPPHDRTRLAQDELDEARIVRRSPAISTRARRRLDVGERQLAALAFETAFCATQSDVAVSQRRRATRAGAAASSAPRSSPGAQLAARPSTPMHRSVGHGRRARSRPRRAAGSPRRPCISDGDAPTRRPSASTPGTRAASASSSTKAPATGASSRATPSARDAGPSVSSIPASGPLTARPAIIGEIATTRSRRATSASRTPVDREDRVERDERVRRREHDHVRRRGGRRARRAQVARAGPRSGRARTRSTARRPTSHCWNSSSPSSVPMRVRSRSSVAGSSRIAEAEPPGDVGGDRRQRLAGAQALAAHEVEADVAVAEDEPVGAPPSSTATVLRRARVARDAPAVDRIDPPRQRVQHRVEIGRHVQAEQLDVVADVSDDRHATGSTAATRPRAKRAPPTPPASSVTRTSDARHEARSAGVSRSCSSRGSATCRPPWRAALPGP